MQKWMRNYRAEFTIGRLDENRKFIADEVITVQYPTTCILDIDLGAYQSACKGVFQFYNLSKTIQSKLWIDLWEIGKKYIILKFYGGYGEVMPLIFQGTLQECTSQKPSGGVDWITQCWGFEGGLMYEHSFINQTVAKGTKIEEILEPILKDMPDVKLGYVSPSIPPLPRNKTFIGQTMDLLGREYGGYEIFISKGELNILAEDEVLHGDILVITDSSGLLGTPRRANLFVEADMLFEPGLKVDQAIELLSDSMPQFNQLYKIIRIQHKGTISYVSCGKLVTTVTMALLQNKPKEVQKAVPEFQNQGTQGQWLKPVKGYISSPFGNRIQPLAGASKNHKGIDIAANMYAPVVAPAPGKIIFRGWENPNNFKQGYGYFVQIDHGNGLVSFYGHLKNEELVSYGQTVDTGTQIGLVGSTGNSNGPHLHFEIRNNGTPVNPLQYIGSY